jgi:hypothetical protein
MHAVQQAAALAAAGKRGELPVRQKIRGNLRRPPAYLSSFFFFFFVFFFFFFFFFFFRQNVVTL